MVITINAPVVYMALVVLILKSKDFQGPPLPMARVMGLPQKNHNVQAPYKIYKQVH
jgi:hypothetical protein